MVARRRDSQKARTQVRLAAAVGIGCPTLVATLWLDWPTLLLPAAIAITALAVLDRRQISALLNKWLWLGLGLAVVLPIWLFGVRVDDGVQRVGGDTAALTAGLTMAVRVLTTLAVLLLISGCIAPASVSRVLGRLVGRELGLACAIGVNLLPAVLEILRRTTLAMRLRGGFKRRRLANLGRLATAVGVQTVRLTEDVAEALLLAQPPGELGIADWGLGIGDYDSRVRSSSPALALGARREGRLEEATP